MISPPPGFRMARYYYSFEGRTLGPVSSDEIMTLILDDKLTTESYVMPVKSPQWVKISGLPDLMRFLHQSDQRLPASDVDLAEIADLDETAPIFFHIPLSRLIVCSLASLGLFEWYWLYKNWHFLRWVRKDQSFGLSFWRDSINPFRLIRIFNKIALDKELNRAVLCKPNFGINGTLWFFTWFASHFLFLIPVQNYINEANAKLGRRYTELSFGHYATMAMGGLGWLLLLIGLIV